MYTFLFLTDPVRGMAERRCTAALEAVRECLPDLGSSSGLTVTPVPELAGALGTLRPEVDVQPSLIQVHVTSRSIAVAHGREAGVARLAERVLASFEAGGPEVAAARAGNASFLVLDRVERRAWVSGTLLGHRALHYAASDRGFAVSPHDIVLLGAGAVDLEVDHVSLASLLGCDWSLGGQSLLRGVRRCHPLELVRWDGLDAVVQRLEHFDLRNRIDDRDDAGRARQVDAVVEGLLDTARREVQGQEAIESSLTAGMDSRAVWASLVATAGVSRLRATTIGEPGSRDVLVARRLASMVGAPHERREPSLPTCEDFDRTSRVRAFLSNGGATAKRALTRAPRLDPAALRVAGGQGGEIFRGFFYPYFGATGTPPSGVAAIASGLVRWRFRRLAKMAWSDPAMGTALEERLLDTLARLAERSREPHDLLDLFYLFERYGCWGAASSQFPWSRSWTPFESLPAIRAAFRLPAPVGKSCPVHALLVRRYLPAAAYWTPINGGQLLALEGRGRARYALRQALNVQALVVQRIRRRLAPSTRTSEELRARFFADELYEVVSALLAEEGSLSRQVLGPGSVEELLASHRKRRNQLALLGIAVTAEQWRRVAHEVRTKARRRGAHS